MRVWGETPKQWMGFTDSDGVGAWDGSTPGHNQDVLTETFNWVCEGTAAGNCESHRPPTTAAV